MKKYIFISLIIFYTNCFGNPNTFLSNMVSLLDFYNNHSDAFACVIDPNCADPNNPSNATNIPVSSCCSSDSQCISQYNNILQKINQRLKTLYHIEHIYVVAVAQADAYMNLAKEASAMTPHGSGAVSATVSATHMKWKTRVTRTFNNRATGLINDLNQYLIELGNLHSHYCHEQNWYNLYGLPIYLNAKTKFSK